MLSPSVENDHTPGFSESIAQLNTILERFRQQQLPLEEALGMFEEGVKHLNVCQAQLAHTRGKVEALVETLSLENSPEGSEG